MQFFHFSHTIFQFFHSQKSQNQQFFYKNKCQNKCQNAIFSIFTHNFSIFSLANFSKSAILQFYKCQNKCQNAFFSILTHIFSKISLSKLSKSTILQILNVKINVKLQFSHTQFYEVKRMIRGFWDGISWTYSQTFNG